MKDKLLKLRKTKVYITGDHSSLICCPFCKADLQKTDKNYLCKMHGLFDIDSSNRPLLIEKKVLKKNTTEHESGINWLKSFLKQFPKLYYLVWHIVCPVMMLVNGPRMVLGRIKKDGITIDIGSGPERLGREFINVDIFPFSESVFEHVPDADKVAREMVRVVKPGGYIYVSAPFVHPYHASPDDFNRWTISGLKHMFPE